MSECRINFNYPCRFGEDSVWLGMQCMKHFEAVPLRGQEVCGGMVPSCRAFRHVLVALLDSALMMFVTICDVHAVFIIFHLSRFWHQQAEQLLLYWIWFETLITLISCSNFPNQMSSLRFRVSLHLWGLPGNGCHKLWSDQTPRGLTQVFPSVQDLMLCASSYSAVFLRKLDG